jgi:NAD(P)-dependent dehydrogenase (short-subunit alcohol dehydrogenase family)
MIYFVTGASGFIGKRLVASLLARPGSKIYFLLRDPSLERVASLRRYWGVGKARAIPVSGDLRKPLLGISAESRKALAGQVDHMFHLGAVYNLQADPELEITTNVEGTRNALDFARAIKAGRFHHISSIAAAGLYDGVFREDMFDEAHGLAHPYFASKHDSERLVREERKVPWRIYRPAVVVGDSRTGEIDKIDGPYYFFKLIQKMRRTLPAWLPMLGIEGGRINLVPVDFVVKALDHLAHLPEGDGACYHLTDPRPRRVGDILAIFAKAGHAPQPAFRINAALFNLIPRGVLQGLFVLAPVRRVYKSLMKDLDLPEDIFTFINYPTRFDNREAERLLAPAGIAVPPLEDYAWRLWDYWERHLDPDLHVDRSLRGQVEGKVVLITGGSSGIGKATAMRVAAAGAKTIIVARDAARLDAVRQEASEQGLTLITYPADISDEAQCTDFIRKLIGDHGHVDILINNAGHSIRRAIEHSYDRFHDFERTMAINYFGALRLMLGLLPFMAEKGKHRHIINISSIGVLANAPHFSAYVASKAALEAWTRCAAAEYLDRGIEFTTINMPLTRTPMIAPTKFYDHVPAQTPEEAADLVVEAIIRRPVRLATRLGIFGQIAHAIAPHFAQVVNNTMFRMFPDSAAAHGKRECEAPTADQIAVTNMLRGVHF